MVHGVLVLGLPLLALSACVVDPVCYDDGDCGEGSVCDAARGRCVPMSGGCARPGDCGDGYRCVAGQCVPSSVTALDCGDDMARVEDTYCIDRYEASRPDATASDMGQDTSRAVSRDGVIPWHVNRLSAGAVAQFAAACQRAGKHLCSRDEWYSACGGREGRTYAYGNVFDAQTCNCVDTFCDEYCAEHGIDDCDLAADCGYTQRSFRIAPTGSFRNCVDAYGAFDVSGNVWEVVASDRDYRGYEVRGGAYNCAGASERLRCTYRAGWLDLDAGFRCCQGPEDGAAP